MRRLLLLAIASCGLLAIAPATSLARSHHHKRHHHARHHITKFGDVPGTSGSSTTGTPTTSPDAGTVASFTNGVLTITLNDGTNVSGTVTNDTEIECMTAENEMGDDMSTDGGGDNSTSGSGDQGDQNDQGDDNGDQGDDNGDQGDDNGDQGDDNAQGEANDNDEQQCDTSALVQAAATHAAVHDAELSISGSGATWKRIDLS